MLSNSQDKCIKFHKSVNGFVVFGVKRCATTQYNNTDKEIRVCINSYFPSVGLIKYASFFS